MGDAIQLSGPKANLIDYTTFGSPLSNDPNKRDLPASVNKGAEYFSDMVSNVIRYIKKLLVPITVLFIVWAGATLILSSDGEEEFDRRKRMIYATFFGWLILLTAVVLVDNIFFGTTGEVFRGADSTVENFAQRGVKEIRGLFKYISSFAVATGVLFIIFSAFKLIIAGGEDESQVSNIKKRIVYTIGGMILLVSANSLISFFSKEIRMGSDVMILTTPNISDTVKFITDWGNFFLGLIGTISVMMLVWGGIRLIANFGIDEQAIENAKKTLIAAAIGLILAFSAWTVMYFVLVQDKGLY